MQLIKASTRLTAARTTASTTRNVVVRAVPREQEQPRASPLLLAAMMALSGGLLAGPMAAPAHAERELTGAEKRAAEKERRKAILRASREEVVTREAAPRANPSAEADARVDEANEKRKAEAAKLFAGIKDKSVGEYEKQAARAVQQAPPV